MRRTGYIVGTAAAGGLIGALAGVLWGFAAQEVGWWGAGMLLGLTIGLFSGVAVADRRA